MATQNPYRKDFPILKTKVHGKPLVYFDNAATTQKPKEVIETLKSYYEKSNANVHRGVHYLSQEATYAYEGAREMIKDFINAEDHSEIIFTRGTTESINLVAATFGRANVKRGDEVIVSLLEHHSNLVPWQMLCKEKGAKLKVIPVNKNGKLDVVAFKKMLTRKTKLVAIIHVSNALGVVTPVEKIVKLAHSKKVPVLIDGTQAIQHMKVDVQKLDCDFYTFSGHKMYGPTGIGVLYGKKELLEKMPPYQTGGEMINSVTVEKSNFKAAPYKFEAGTPNIAGAVGLAAAIDYMNNIGMGKIARVEKLLHQYAVKEMSKIEGLRIIGKTEQMAPVVSFTLKGMHPHDLGTILDQEGVAIRTGHHCAQPIMQFFDIPATARASFAFYNTKSEIDKLVKGIKKAKKVFGI